MRIVLLRHGRPDLPTFGWCAAHEMGRWIECYDAAGIIADRASMARAAEIAATCNVTVGSDLPRAIDSANALGLSSRFLVNPVFREMDLPHAAWGGVRLPPQLWAGFFRVLWLAGLSFQAEPFESARARAKAAADCLRDLAAAHGSVLLVGHGMMNRFIARELRSTGWRGPRNLGRNYWDFSVYHNHLS